ncbi:PREDICTED: GTP-binding protein RAD [Mandrillus leucophaeus]|nr:PREDICTED: GTP-binding protein RAD [Mandrillus leucophaeus]
MGAAGVVESFGWLPGSQAIVGEGHQTAHATADVSDSPLVTLDSAVPGTPCRATICASWASAQGTFWNPRCYLRTWVQGVVKFEVPETLYQGGVSGVRGPRRRVGDSPGGGGQTRQPPQQREPGAGAGAGGGLNRRLWSQSPVRAEKAVAAAAAAAVTQESESRLRVGGILTRILVLSVSVCEWAGTGTQGPRLDWPEDSEDSLSSGGSDSDESVYKVLLLGAPGVGKSALARIFGGVEDGPEAEAAGHTYDRSIVVDGEEASLMVYDIWEQDGGRWLPGHCMAMGDAYVIVYSVTDKGSFEKASELRVQLRRARQTDDVPIILVGNKSDLVRSREVSVDEGRACAVVFDCKFIETSAALHHNVQALFEGVVRQIRLRRDSKEANARRQAGTRRRESLGKKAKRFLGRIVARNSRKMAFRAKSKSCHDLSVL